MVDSARVLDFEEQLQGLLLRPDSPGYEEARTLWNGMIDRRPALIVRCKVPRTWWRRSILPGRRGCVLP